MRFDDVMIFNSITEEFVILLNAKVAIVNSFEGTSEDYTTFAIAKDLTNNIMYLRAHDYVSIRSIHMDRLPDNSSVWMPVEGSFDDGVKDVTGQMVQ